MTEVFALECDECGRQENGFPMKQGDQCRVGSPNGWLLAWLAVDGTASKRRTPHHFCSGECATVFIAERELG